MTDRELLEQIAKDVKEIKSLSIQHEEHLCNIEGELLRQSNRNSVLE